MRLVVPDGTSGQQIFLKSQRRWRQDLAQRGGGRQPQQQQRRQNRPESAGPEHYFDLRKLMFHGFLFLLRVPGAWLGFGHGRNSPATRQSEMPGKNLQLILKRNLKTCNWLGWDVDSWFSHKPSVQALWSASLSFSKTWMLVLGALTQLWLTGGAAQFPDKARHGRGPSNCGRCGRRCPEPERLLQGSSRRNSAA